jgi:nucleoside-diphosphate-sugar epimerase
MKIAFLGGTRFIGLRAVVTAHNRGHSVAVLHRGLHNADLPKGVNEIIVDRDDRLALSMALKELKADVLVDTFAMTNNQTLRTIDALAGNVATVVVLSSQDVYAQFGRLNGHPSAVEKVVSESSPLTVRFPFRGIDDHEGGIDYDKKDVEIAYNTASQKLFESTTVLRLPAVYGSGDYKRRLGFIVDSLDQGLRKFPYQSGANWRWTLGHVENVAHSIILSAERKVQGHRVFNVGEEFTPTMHDRVDKIAKILGVSLEWEEVRNLPGEFGILGKMPNDFVVDTATMRVDLGYKEVLSEDACYLDLITWCRQSREA